MSNKLIAYYSRADENYLNGMIQALQIGNTEKAASILKDLTEADLFKIEQVNPYAKEYNECIAQAQEDQRKDARPQLKRFPDNMDTYDTIYLGFPNYWGTMPMAVFTFLEHFDFSDKTIYPFCTHEGSGMGHSEADIKHLCPNAKVEKGLAIQGCKASQSKKQFEQWLKR